MPTTTSFPRSIAALAPCYRLSVRHSSGGVPRGVRQRACGRTLLFWKAAACVPPTTVAPTTDGDEPMRAPPTRDTESRGGLPRANGQGSRKHRGTFWARSQTKTRRLSAPYSTTCASCCAARRDRRTLEAGGKPEPIVPTKLKKREQCKSSSLLPSSLGSQRRRCYCERKTTNFARTMSTTTIVTSVPAPATCAVVNDAVHIG